PPCWRRPVELGRARPDDLPARSGERTGPEPRAVQVERTVLLARLDLAVLEPLVPGRDDHPVRIGLHGRGPLIVVLPTVGAIDEEMRWPIEAAVVEHRVDRRHPDPAPAVRAQ